jgi:uncharacterized membrane protein YphA (DoxX/SURF4 family)
MVGGLFVYAAWEKLLHPDWFAEVLLDYQLLPPEWINLLAVWLPMLELVVGISLVLGFWVRANSLLVVFLVLVFVGAMGTALMVGRDVRCGCFTVRPGGGTRSWVSLWQEGALVVGALLLWVLSWPGAAAPAPGNQLDKREGL